MKKITLIVSVLCILMLVASITTVYASSTKSILYAQSCSTYPGTCSGCKQGVSGLYCRNINSTLKGVVGVYDSACNMTDYWDCPNNKCHCAVQGWPDHCCLDWNDCRPNERN